MSPLRIPNSVPSLAHQRRNRVVLGVLSLVALGLALALILVLTLSSGTTGSISVTGSGTATATPNTASFQVTVQTIMPTAVGGLSANNKKVATLEAALEKDGIKKKDLQTSGFNEYQNTNDQGVVTGYTVQDTLNVTVHSISGVGRALDISANVAGNSVQLSDVSFSFSNQGSLLKIAREKAVANALRQARQLASASGASLNGVLRITDQENVNNSPSPIAYTQFTTARALSGSTSVPVQAGTQSVSVQVSVEFSLHS